jgi:hypothetical protein
MVSQEIMFAADLINYMKLGYFTQIRHISLPTLISTAVENYLLWASEGPRKRRSILRSPWQNLRMLSLFHPVTNALMVFGCYQQDFALEFP